MARHVLLIVAPFYRHITDQLVDGATAVLKANDTTFDVIEVPGAMEIPPVVHYADIAHRRDPRQATAYDGYVALGCVIRGETSHYDYVAGECCRALMDLALRGMAIGNGVLTVENEAQALVRCDPSKKNKGGDAAQACLSVIDAREALMGGSEE